MEFACALAFTDGDPKQRSQTVLRRLDRSDPEFNSLAMGSIRIEQEKMMTLLTSQRAKTITTLPQTNGHRAVGPASTNTSGNRDGDKISGRTGFVSFKALLAEHGVLDGKSVCAQNLSTANCELASDGFSCKARSYLRHEIPVEISKAAADALVERYGGMKPGIRVRKE